jgi:hypothetical protein
MSAHPIRNPLTKVWALSPGCSSRWFVSWQGKFDLVKALQKNGNTNRDDRSKALDKK